MIDLHGPSSHTEADYSLVHRSDIATFGTGNVIWINGTQPLGFPLLNLEPGLRTTGTPTGPFPFARLASVTSQSLTYLYHQINGTTFAEETWDDTEGSWGPTQYIHVTKS